MCDIIVGIYLATRIHQKVKDKGRSSVPWVLLFLLLYFGGEISGIIGGLVLAGNSGGAASPNLAVLLCGLLGAAIGAIISFSLVNNLAPAEQEREEFWDRRPDLEFDRDNLEFKAPRWPGAEEDTDAYRARPQDETYRKPGDEE